jgi:hypothetical protein
MKKLCVLLQKKARVVTVSPNDEQDARQLS